MSAAPHVDVTIEAEQALLGAMLLNGNVAFHKVSSFLRQEHFSNAVHGRIFAVISDLVARGAAADLLLMSNTLGDDPVLVPIGGAAQYITRLLQSAGPPINAPYYAQSIIDAARRRALVEAGRQIIEAANT